MKNAPHQAQQLSTGRDDGSQPPRQHSQATENCKNTTQGLFLTHEELVDLTGFKTSSGHARWLEKNHWRFVLTRSEQPRVSRDFFLERMGSTRGKTGFNDTANQAGALEEPDFSAMDRI